MNWKAIIWGQCNGRVFFWLKYPCLCIVTIFDIPLCLNKEYITCNKSYKNKVKSYNQPGIFSCINSAITFQSVIFPSRHNPQTVLLLLSLLYTQEIFTVWIISDIFN